MSSYLINEIILIPSIYYYIFVYILRFVIVIYSNDWFMVWFGLEVNIISFIVMVYKRFRIKGVESCLKYFFIQSLGSGIIVSIIFYRRNVIRIMLLLVLRLKLGAGPFFFWFPVVCEGLNWTSCYLLITFQKIIPLILICLFLRKIVRWIVVIRLLFGVFGRYNQVKIKQLIAFSSIHHLGWILLCIINGGYYFIVYLFIYRLVLLGIFYYLIKNNVIYIMDIIKYKDKWIFILGIIRIAGIPPFLGFFLKWIAFNYIINIGILWIVTLIIISVIMLYVYIRLIYDTMIGYSKTVSWDIFLYSSDKNYYYDIINIYGVIPLVILGIFLLW